MGVREKLFSAMIPIRFLEKCPFSLEKVIYCVESVKF